MHLSLILTAVLLGQTDEAQPPIAPPTSAETIPAAEAVPAPAVRAQPKGAEEAARLKEKFSKMTSEEQVNAIAEFRKKFGTAEVNAVLPPESIDTVAFSALDDVSQATVIARSFFDALARGDVKQALQYQGLPFMLEERRLDKAEDLKAEWSRHTRAKRTDLMVTYGVEVLSPAEMEKKYGKPPPRLNGWNWRSGKTLVAVGNISGRARVLLLRQIGASWQIVAYHD